MVPTILMRINRSISSKRTDVSIPKKLEFTDCTSIGVGEQTDYMHIEQIDLSPMHICMVNASSYNRKSKSSAELLPYRDMHFDFILFFDNLALPYDLPVPGNGQLRNINAIIKLAIKVANTSLNHSGRFGLIAEVRSIDFN